MRGLQLYQNQLFNGFICRTLYYGLEGDWQFARNQRFYLNVDREEGHDYTNDVAVRFGYRLAF